MKQSLLLFTFLIFFLLTISCEKAGQIHLISAHTWVVTNNSPVGSVGDEYRFHDNRLFFKTSGGSTSDGKWNYQSDLFHLYIETDFGGNTQYEIKKLTATELELVDNNGFLSQTFYLIPKS